MKELLSYSQEFLLQILLALMSLISIYIVSYVNKLKNQVTEETNKIADKKTSNLVNTSIEQLNDLIKTCVQSMEQEVASEIRKKLQSGDTSVSREDLCSLKNKVYDTVINTIDPSVIEYASKVIKNTEQYILDKISEEVRKIKLDNSEGAISIPYSTSNTDSSTPSVTLL